MSHWESTKLWVSGAYGVVCTLSILRRTKDSYFLVLGALLLFDTSYLGGSCLLWILLNLHPFLAPHGSSRHNMLVNKLYVHDLVHLSNNRSSINVPHTVVFLDDILTSCDLAMLTTNGVLITVTADVKTTVGVQIITHCPVAMAQSLPLLAFVQTADAASWELLLRWNPFFRRIYSNSFQTRLRRLLGLTEADQMPKFRGTQFSKLVLDPISQRLPSQLGAPWAEWHKKDAARQWAIVLDMPTRPLNTPHVVPDILHQMYPSVLWWAANLVATPPQKFPAGSPSSVKVRRVPVEQALRVLSTL